MIYMVHGADSFRAREKLKELIEAFREKDPNQMNLDIFDIEETDVKRIKAAAQMVGFLSSARMIVIKNLFSKGNIEAKKEIADFAVSVSKQDGSIAPARLRSPQVTTGKSPVFVFFESAEIGKKGSAGGKEWSALVKNAEVFLFEPLDSGKIRQWILDRVKKQKVKMTPAVAGKLALYVGNDLWRLSHEIDKLVLLKSNPAKKGESDLVITEEDIESMVKSDIPASIFTTIDALARRDKKMALKLLEEHLEKGEAPLYLFSMFVYQFSNLIRVKDLLQRRTTNPGEIARLLKMHPFVAQKTIPYAAKFNFEYLKKVYKRLLRFDFMIKKGRLDPEVALEMIVIEVGNLS